MGDVAVTVDKDADTVPAFTTTVAVCLIATEFIVADAVFGPAAVELGVPVICPFTSVVPTGWVRVLPAVGVAASVTVAPGIGFPFASRAVTVSSDERRVGEIGDVAATVDVAAETLPTCTSTVAVWAIATD